MGDQDSGEVKLARMQQQIAALVDTVGRIERKVDEVVTLDRTIVQLQTDYKHQATEMATQWSRIDTLGDKLLGVDQKADKWINTARGAWFATVVLGTIVQGVIGWAVVSVVTSVQDLRERNAVNENRVSKIERDQLPHQLRPDVSGR